MATATILPENLEPIALQITALAFIEARVANKELVVVS